MHSGFGSLTRHYLGGDTRNHHWRYSPLKVEIRQVVTVNYDEVIPISEAGDDPKARPVLEEWIRHSPLVWEGRINGEVACVFGLIPKSIFDDEAYIWMLTTSVAKEHPFVFLRHAQIMLKRLFKIYNVIYGHVLPSNTHSVKWLKWLGMKPRGMVHGMIEFEIRSA